MAEPVSSALTLATVSLAMIRSTVKFIQEARVIDSLVEKLLITLLDLRKLIKVVDSTCRHPRSREDDPSRYVRDTLARCHTRLGGVQLLVESLASRKSKNFLQKVALKIKSDRSRVEIEQAIQHIKDLMDQIHTGISCWTLHITSEMERRASGAVPILQPLATRMRASSMTEADPNPQSPSWSEADTIYSASSASRRNSEIDSREDRRAVTSIGAMTPSWPHSTNPIQRIDSITSETISENPKNDWVNFHYKTKQCESQEKRVAELRAILQDHSNGASLANSIDSSQRTPLHHAAQRGDVELAKVLQQFGADLNARDSQPSSILDLAVQHNQLTFVYWLLQNGVNESGISKSNRERFGEIKATIALKRKILEKNGGKLPSRRNTSMSIPV
ncbi:hypothetical protein P154DRAFT_67518 [Amniculicola lignicola CBS 123094]|uniref:Uncharacterized protein n=1 Tax=Amniculicola lignicola CBS 123094 TaxID=1392246 RepID=A0A6A5WSX3_9PLEO|nr:hypothetical protein P154DRAFT_67518 [Amniculicola lignicola CBS 123094]